MKKTFDAGAVISATFPGCGAGDEEIRSTSDLGAGADGSASYAAGESGGGKIRRIGVSVAVVLSLAGCGSSDDENSFAVKGTRTADGAPLFGICVSGIHHIDPGSDEGHRTADQLATYYEMSGTLEIASGKNMTCNETMPLATVISHDFFNSVVVPALARGENHRGPIKPPTQQVSPPPVAPPPSVVEPPPVVPPSAQIPPNGGQPKPTSDNQAQQRGFINWTNSTNGEVVVDASNDRFKFFADTRCIYSLNRKEETTNFCLGPRPSASGNFAGLPVDVVAIRSTEGGCIAGLADPATGLAIDIYTESDIQFVRVSDQRWTGC